MLRNSTLLLAFALACTPCEDDCTEYVELSFVSVDATGAFPSTRYEIVVDADGRIASCEIEVDRAVGDVVECQGDATIMMDDGTGDGGDGTGGGAPGKPTIVLRWDYAPEVFDVVVRDEASTLVLSNTLTPAYQDQGTRSCDGQCERFGREIVLTQ